MAAKNNLQTSKIFDMESYKRTLLFQKISPKTTKQSLENFLSEYPFEQCSVPTNEEGHNKFHAIVKFEDESSITLLMSKRPLIIDGKEVFIHRHVPDQKSSRDNRDVQVITVSSTTNQSMQKSQLQRYFRKYGEMDHIDCVNDNNSVYVIHFKDYDSVDRALLNQPHEINGILVDIRKGDQHLSTVNPDSEKSLPNPNNYKEIVPPKKSNLKVTIDPKISSLYLPERIYCVHIKNLPINIDAERLSVELNWPVYDILMGSPTDDDQSPSMECWLKSPDDQEKIDEFIRNSKQRTINRSIIQCEKEEDQLELCRFFRTGKCDKRDDICNWVHIKCTANRTCSRDCPYGHEKGEKTEYSTVNKTTMSYRIKISGFEKKPTRKSLAELLHQQEKSCYVNENQNKVGYIIYVITFKYAKHLMKKWHDKSIDGQKLKCQLEINQPSNMHSALSRSKQSLSGSNSELNTRWRRTDRSSISSSTQHSRESSVSRDEDRSEIRVLNDECVGHEGRLYAQAFNGIGKSLEKLSMRTKRSTENIASALDSTRSLPSGIPSDEWETIQRASGTGKRASFIRRKSDRRTSAVIKVYKNEPTGDWYRELTALKMLKGVPGVVQLIEPEQQSNNFGKKAGGEDDLWIIMQRASTHSLKTFMDQKREKYKTDIEVSSAIKFVQHLIGIVKQVHSRGILHQNLEPENIVIEYESKNPSIDEANLTLLNFTQAYIKSHQSTHINQENAIRWYQQPEANAQSFKYSATNDASAIVAILLWLLTDVIPQHREKILPHLKPEVHDKLDRKFSNVANIANGNQLKTYLIDTFNRAFGFPEYEPWTIEDLECRIKCISQLFTPSHSNLNTVGDIFRNLIPLTTSFKMIPTNDHPAAIQNAANAFTQVKQEFLNSNSDQYSWFDGNCTWLNTAQHPMNEYRHDDILTYYWRNQNYSIIIICLASINDEGRVITLSIGSTVHGKMIRIPLGQYSVAQDYLTKLQENFSTELKNLLLSIYNEQMPVQK
ncbi:unnamed protein product [Rotaria socialis]|uniref:Uncharacterized protein n=2 Tax=Rotaria socialis TaxID=392032 RepID=A0A820HKZ0_9BILA|nr:unnamed protein product [Rotaria socialis]